MDAAAVSNRKPGASDLLLKHCLALDRRLAEAPERQSPTADVRLEALIGSEMARRLLLALCPHRSS